MKVKRKVGRQETKLEGKDKCLVTLYAFCRTLQQCYTPLECGLRNLIVIRCKTIKSIPNKNNKQNKQKKKPSNKNKASRNSGNRATLVLSAHRMYAITVPINVNRQINTILNLSLFP